jgi:hypothetical protein
MALNLILKLNNEIVQSYSSSVRILNGFPIFNWEFKLIDKVDIDEDTGKTTEIENYAQSSYEIRIGSYSLVIGSDAYGGDVVQTGKIQGQEMFWQYDGSLLERGTIYYGQMRAQDEILRYSEWMTFSFLYNSLPYIEDISIIPSLPSVTDDLQLSYDFFDDDGDLETDTSIRWFKNGAYQRQFDNALLIQSSFLQNEDIWNADVYPSDGYEFGERITSDQVKVISSAITISDIEVLPRNPNPNDILKAEYVTSDEFEQDKVLIRWYINEQIDHSLNDQQYIRLYLSENDLVRFEVKHIDGGFYYSSSVVTIVASDFVISDITIDGQPEPLLVSSVTPTVKWRKFVPDDKTVNYTSIKIGKFYEDDSVYSIIIDGDKDRFIIPANLLGKGRDYYISIAMSNTQIFDKYYSSHFRIKGSRWEENVSNSVGWTIETLFIVDTADIDKYQVIRINDGSKFAEIRLYSNKIKLISGDQVEYLVNTTTKNVLTIVGKDNDIKIYLNRQLIIDGEGVFTQTSNIKRLELGNYISDTVFNVRYKYVFYTTSGFYLPGIDDEYSEMQFHTYMEFDDNEVVALQGYIEGQYVFGLNPDNVSDSSSVYAIKSGDAIKSVFIPRTYSPINKISKSPDNDITVCAHAKGVSVLTGYFINPFTHELIFVDDNGVLNNTLPTDSGWELVNNADLEAASFDGDGFHINTIN